MVQATIKVWPKNDDMRRVLVHPTGGGFRPEGPTDWPNDSFTHRRVRDGDVTTEEPKEGHAPKAAKSDKPKE